MHSLFKNKALYLALLLLLAGCAGKTSTVTVGGVAVEMPEEVAEEHQKIVDNIGIYDDPELDTYVRQVGEQLLREANITRPPFTFTLLDSPDINAFAMPGGFIYVNRGLLAYLDNEAELAGVLAHEIGHITENHHSRRQTAQMTSKVASVSAYILTGSGDVYDAANMYGAEIISGFGRDMELEADSAGAEYLHQTGYDVDSMLSVIGVLKDQERYRRAQAKASGKPSGTYHGLYASHPRNDLRLQTVIRAANELDLAEMPYSPEIPGEYRRQTEGMVYGASAAAQGDTNRFYHNKLNFTFAHPPGWRVQQSSREVIATSADGSRVLTIGLARINPDEDTEVSLRSGANGDVSEVDALEQYGLGGTTAIATSGSRSVRLAVIDHRYRFLFEGDAPTLAEADTDFRTIIDSFRPLTAKEKITGTSHTLHYVQVPRGATFASLASSVKLSDAENQLRLINGYYPSGEPRTGDWIKVIR
ncbi:M48 family metalloprotease [Luminiphilus sp.]|nr:M48 family metalloprotease [Luminiphilus sp.]MDA9666838.1 M48 family metalloprotease [Luminiphilus sp.]